MPVDDAIAELANTVEEGQPWPRPRCPNCASGHIRFGTPIEHESFASASSRTHWAWEPEWVRGTFSVVGECENPVCKQSVHGAGEYEVRTSEKSVPDDPWYDGPETYSSFYLVRQLFPPLLLMRLPQSAPKELRDGLLRASRVFHADPGLSATALRSVVERYMTTEGIAATGPSGRFRPVQERIDEWRKGNASREPLAQLFFAVKWLGNAGTHEDKVLVAEQVLDGARLLDEAFHRIYTGPDIDAQAQSINSAKGPNRGT